MGRPNVGDRDSFTQMLNGMFDRRWLTNHGPLVQELEREIASRLQVQHCIAVCNATVALEILVRALGLRGEVIVPSFTFVATAHALQWQEIRPVFCDVDPKTHKLDPVQVERLIGPRTTGIIGVHVWGRPCAVDALEAIAARRQLQLIFDAAHAFDNTFRGRRLGGSGKAEVFSFHATKFFNTFEGGAITTNDGELAAKIRLMKNFGFADYDKVVHLGTNGKMTEVCAAMGLANLESIDQFVAINRRNHEAYRQGVQDIPGVRLTEYAPEERCNYQYVVLEIEAESTGITRDLLQRVLQAENVLARRYFYPGCHRMEPYRSLDPDASSRLPETQRLCERVLVLPTGTNVTPDAIASICRVIGIVVDNGRAISDWAANSRRDGVS